MKCSVCQAQLMPVAGEMFCLQCGEAVNGPPTDAETVDLKATTDPILQRALLDATDGEITFEAPAPVVAAVPVAAVAPATPKPTPSHTFASLRAALAPARPVLAMAGGGGMGVAAPLVKASTTEATEGALDVKDAGLVNLVAPHPLGDTLVASTVPVVKPGHSRGMWLAWASGLVGLVLFVAANVAVGNYYSNRVYPGVKVGSLAVGGLTFEQLDRTLAQKLPAPKLTVVAGKDRVALDDLVLGSVKLDEVKRTAQSAGRAPLLPVVAVVESWFARPIAPQYEIHAAAVTQAVTRVSERLNRPAVSATPMVVGTNVIVIAERPGQEIDAKAAQGAIAAAYGHAATVTLKPKVLAPRVLAADYADEVAAAQTTMGLSLAVTVRGVRHAPTAEQVGQWLVFDAPAKGLGVDAEAVASYVRAIPGAFDKQAAFGALMTGLNGRQAVAVTPSIKKNTVVAPQLRSATALPMTEYNYCLGDNADLKTVSAMVLGQSSGWGLGGRVAYKVVAGNCSFRLQVANTAAMKALDPACERQTSCRIHNDLAISEASWAVAPAGWDGGLASYRAELVNHVVGQWLGFTHPACTAVAEQTPTLESPAVVIPGCSAKWYAVPVELQDTKVLGGF